jgi:hypothetical protein
MTMNTETQAAQSAELWVHEPGYQTVHATNPRFHVIRNGDMRVIRKCDGAIFRYTQDLIEAGIDNDEAVDRLYNGSGYQVVDNPWFEVVDMNDPSDEGVVYQSLDDAIECATILYNSLGNDNE